MNRIICMLVFSLFPFLLFGQASKASSKEIKAYENAVIMVNEGKYKEALPILNTLVRENKNFVDASWTLAELYGKMRNEPRQISTLQNVAKPKIPRYYNSLMRLAAAYHGMCNYEEAIKTYELIPSSESTFYRIAQQEIQQAKNAIELRGKPVPFNIRNMGKNINTEYDDYWPSITADESLFSTTIKVGKLEGQSDFGRGVHEDIFISKKEDGEWTPTQNAGTALNTMGNEGAQSFSLDGRYLFFVACDRHTGLGGCDIYYSIRMGDLWSEAINPGAPLNSRHWETYPSFSPTGDEIYFASNRPGGTGKSDIWKSKVTIQENGMLKFSEPVNLGSAINTPEDELSPFIHADNHTLYYSSKGLTGMGGYDVFVSYKDSLGKWSKGKNIGYPLNTCKDEIGFVVNAYGDKAYFSSDGQEKNGQGRDIYEIKLEGGNYRPIKKMKYARGKIVDVETMEPIQAQIDVFSIKSNETVFRSVSDRKTGDFVVCAPEDEDIGVNVNKKGYMLYSENFTPDNPVQFDLKTGIPLDKIEIGKSVILKNIFFDFDEFTLKKESYLELDRLVAFMKLNPKVRIRLDGHTDIKGTQEYNMTLSVNRAKAAYNYLISKGILKSRLEYKGYGKNVPIADNSTAAGRTLNRRTEIVIIAK
ncbi:MAG: OmpA family protein [Prevotellaceae bacterium]|nr:OmpA family protein [Prevotellaceae bacterium]